MNVEAGNLARIVRNGNPDVSSELVDMIVEVVRPAVDGESFTALTGEIAIFSPFGTSFNWVIRSKTPLRWQCSTHLGGSVVLFFAERAIGDEYLRRIGGVPVDEDVKDEVPA